MDSSVLGINAPGLDALYRELELKKEIICEKLDRIQTAYDKLSDFCIGAQFVDDEFKNNISKTREALEYNIDSYIQDLRTLQERLVENDKYISGLFLEATAEQNAKNRGFDSSSLIRENNDTTHDNYENKEQN